MTFPIEHEPLRSLAEVEAEREANEDSYDDNPAASFKDGDQ